MTLVCPCCEAEVEATLDVAAFLEGDVTDAAACPTGCGSWRYTVSVEWIEAPEMRPAPEAGDFGGPDDSPDAYYDREQARRERDRGGEP